jgi:hypothetical protein
MKKLSLSEKIKSVLIPKLNGIQARLFVTREDGITIFDSVQDTTTTSVAALVCGLWQASEALINLAHPKQDILEFRLGFDTSSQGVFLYPFVLEGKRFFLGAIYSDCLNPAQLKRRIAMIKEEIDRLYPNQEHSYISWSRVSERNGFLFQDITDEEMDRLFSVGGV